MMRGELFARTVAALVEAGIDNPRLEARLLICHAQELSPPQEGRGDAIESLATFVQRRIAREPLAYILGRKEFYGLNFAAGPGVLVPRPDSETLIEALLKIVPDRQAPLCILDLGAGSGCLIVTALHLYPRAHGVALDCSSVALDYTARNAAAHGAAGRLSLIEGDFADAAGRFDVVLSNPPYLTADELAQAMPELAHEPAFSLESGRDGLNAYRALAPVLARVLKPDGTAFVELGAGQGGAVRAIFEAAGLGIVDIAADLAGIPRALIARPVPGAAPEKKDVGMGGPSG